MCQNINVCCRVVATSKPCHEIIYAAFAFVAEFILNIFMFKFIVGPDIAMLRIMVSSARICNINDEVTQWNILDNSKF